MSEPTPPSTQPLYNAVPIDNLTNASFRGQLWPQMAEHPFATLVWRIEQTSEAELAAYGETPAYLERHWGIGTVIALVARLRQGREVLYACDKHPGASHCEHAQILEDALVRSRANRRP